MHETTKFGSCNRGRSDDSDIWSRSQVNSEDDAKVVHLGEPVCILVTLAEPRPDITIGGFMFGLDSGGYAFGPGGVPLTRISDTSVKICHPFGADAPEGVYSLVSFVLQTSAGKRKEYRFPADFKEPVKFTFENHAKDLPAVTDVKRVNSK